MKIFYEIRNAIIEDASGIMGLSNQLGYPSSQSETQERLESVLNSDDHSIFIAYTPENKIIGWVHAYKRISIESGFFAEIGGFVVSKTFRDNGIGRDLLNSIEQWALQKNFSKLRVRSQIKRESAKRFYSNMGFAITKTQRVFDKILRTQLL